jgi:NAD(P)-dependent dehydrogenase (short-subunit alcohol dehydrogenase family)
MDALFSLADRIALVTGGTRGIGRMIAAGLLAHGARVYLVGRSDDACRAAARELGGDARDCIALTGDVARRDDRARIAAALARREQRLDILVNNAGTASRAPFGSVAEAEWDRVMDVNLKAPFFLTQALVGLLRASVAATGRPAKVINVASVDGIGVNTGETYAYQVSKAGLIHMTRSLGARLAPEGVMVTCIAPGAFPSDMNLVARDRPDEFAKWIPAGRVGRPEDMAGAVLFLAARSGDYVAGEVIAVDGGCVRAAATHGVPIAIRAGERGPAS